MIDPTQQTKQTVVHLTPADRLVADALQKQLDQPSLSSLVRHLLRAKSRELGIDLPASEPRGPGRPRKGNSEAKSPPKQQRGKK